MRSVLRHRLSGIEHVDYLLLEGSWRLASGRPLDGLNLKVVVGYTYSGAASVQGIGYYIVLRGYIFVVTHAFGRQCLFVKANMHEGINCLPLSTIQFRWQV